MKVVGSCEIVPGFGDNYGLATGGNACALWKTLFFFKKFFYLQGEEKVDLQLLVIIEL